MAKSTRMEKVIDFNREILHIEDRAVGLQDSHESALSFAQMREEANEFRDANDDRDLIGVIDAVVDELYFCYGILYKLGLSEDMVNDMFTAVHNANMCKAKGVKKGREGFNAADAGKPDNWVDPRKVMEEILNAHSVDQ